MFLFFELLDREHNPTGCANCNDYGLSFKDIAQSLNFFLSKRFCTKINKVQQKEDYIPISALIVFNGIVPAYLHELSIWKTTNSGQSTLSQATSSAMEKLEEQSKLS